MPVYVNAMHHTDTLLRIADLQVDLGRESLLRGLSLELGVGEILGLVGESGSGKSLTALSILQLLEVPGMERTGGSISFDGFDLHTADESKMESIRGGEIGMIFQEQMTSLNPVFSVVDQIVEALLLHQQSGRSSAKTEAVALIERVGIHPAASVYSRYPHQLSGGQRQRIMIAMAIACQPKLLIADEPTTALDVTVQAQILELLDSLRTENRMSILLIAHDLGVVRQYCDRVAVMYCGQVVECGTADDVFDKARHPYTRALINTIPAGNPPGTDLPSIEGTVPKPSDLPLGCAFSPRCRYAAAKCLSHAPELRGDVHAARCWYPLDLSTLAHSDDG